MNNRDLILEVLDNNEKIGISKPLATALIKQMGGARAFEEIFHSQKSCIDDEVYGFSGNQAVTFYHEHKADLLACVRAKSKTVMHGYAFDWFELNMNYSPYDRDAVAAAIHEPYSTNPSVGHLIVAGIAIQLAGNIMGDYYKKLVSDQRKMHS